MGKRGNNRIFVWANTFAGIAMLVFLVFPGTVLGQTREELEAELKKIEAKIAEYEKELSTTKTQKNTLINKINQLKKEQASIALQIRATNLQISKLGGQISSTQVSILSTEQKLRKSKKQTTEIIRAIEMENRKPLVVVMLESPSISVFLGEVEIMEKLSEKLGEAIVDLKYTKSELQEKKSDLEDKQTEQKNLLSVKILQRQTLESKTGEQNKLLKETQGKEAKYQNLIADSKKRAQEIRDRIYELLGVSKSITFGEAVDIAKWASSKTGVRAEFLLAVLTQESNLGKNVGTCNRVGDPPSKSWKNIMKPTRDQEPFLLITKELGLNPDTVPVSCPMKDASGKQFGWGGAMGPAQFIPSTWVLYKDSITAITGKSANPWDIRDAFLGAALLLRDNGAASGKSNAEWRAAMLYFSGSTNTKYRFYGDNVVAIAKGYEADIKALG